MTVLGVLRLVTFMAQSSRPYLTLGPVNSGETRIKDMLLHCKLHVHAGRHTDGSYLEGMPLEATLFSPVDYCHLKN